MGHKCDYFGSLVTTAKDIYIKIEARYKNKKAIIYKEHINGKAEVRYVYLSSCVGYVVNFPNERLNYYYGYGIQQVERFSKCDPFNLYVNWNTKQADFERMEKVRPELKYFIKKQQIPNIYNFIRILSVYIKHPEIEPLIELGLNRLVLDKRLYKLKPEKKKAVIKEIITSKNLLHDELSLSTILTWIKRGHNYIKNQYLGLTDYNPQPMKYGLYKIFIPNNVELCKKQAIKLNQCIMSSSYVKEMAKHKTILIFITHDDGTPIATCQIDHNKAIKQFYADEHDHDNCNPTKDMKIAMTKYLNRLDMNQLYIGV